MTSNGYQDISALLKSLTSYRSTPVQPPQQEQGQSPIPDQRHRAQKFHPIGDLRHYSAEESDRTDLHDCYADAQWYNTTTPEQQAKPTSNQSAAATPDSQQQQPQTTSKSSTSSTHSKLTQDARTITTWPAALRHVTTLLAQNPTTSDNIKKMIANQAENENSWWAGRQALIRQQEARESGQKQLDDVLRSVGAQPSSGPELTDPVAELKRYDTKVHSAAVKMVETMSLDFAAMRIPFFGLRPDLVSESHDLEGQRAGHKDEPKSTVPDNKISRKELVRLQRKMLAFLEEYCKD